APMAHMTMPKYMSAVPLTPPRPSNLTGLRSGILMSASLPKALVARVHKQIRTNIQGNLLAFLIILERRDYAKAFSKANPFLAKFSPTFNCNDCGFFDIWRQAVHSSL